MLSPVPRARVRFAPRLIGGDARRVAGGREGRRRTVQQRMGLPVIGHAAQGRRRATGRDREDRFGLRAGRRRVNCVRRCGDGHGGDRGRPGGQRSDRLGQRDGIGATRLGRPWNGRPRRAQQVGQFPGAQPAPDRLEGRLLHKRDKPGDVGGRETCSGSGAGTIRTGHGGSGREDVDLRSRRRRSRDAAVGTKRSHRQYIRAGRRMGDTRAPRIAGRRDGHDAGLGQRAQPRIEIRQRRRIGARQGFEGKIDGDDAVTAGVGQNPVESLGDVGRRPAPIGVERAQDHEPGFRRHALARHDACAADA
jgi:hypothetical protein